MTQLEKYREEIIEVDKQIAKFLEKRFEIVTKIGDYKREKDSKEFVYRIIVIMG